jgi:hypothetical protein
MADKISIVVTINGLPTTLDFGPRQPLHAVITEALARTGNTLRKAEDWQATNAAGDLLDPRKTLAELGLISGSQLFLSVGAGVGGGRC